jgi:hypothetical protein
VLKEAVPLLILTCNQDIIYIILGVVAELKTVRMGKISCSC